MALPATMKGLQIVEFKKPYRLSHNIPVPKIERDNEVLIKVVVAGYCHTEIMVQNGGFEKKMRAAGRSLPLIPSHECSGIVAAIGSGVKNLKVCFIFPPEHRYAGTIHIRLVIGSPHLPLKTHAADVLTARKAWTNIAKVLTTAAFSPTAPLLNTW